MSKLTTVFKSPWKIKLYFLKKLPSLFFWGIKIKEINQNRSEILIKYNWRTQNPFNSIYFSALAGAAELSTGLLALSAIENHNVSMLVVGMNASFFKKAKGKVVFVCEDGDKIKKTVKKAIETKEGQILSVSSRGFNKKKEIIAEFEFTWSFKKRKEN